MKISFSYSSHMVLLLLSISMLVSCGSDSSSDTSANKPPTVTTVANNIDVAENTRTVLTVAANDPDGDALIFSLGTGQDEAYFSIGPQTGAVEFITAPDYENPSDGNIDNIYDVVINISDATHSISFVLAITVLDIEPETIIPGSLDTSFNGKGYFTINNAIGGEVVVTAEGNFVVVGSIFGVSGNLDMAVWQLKPDGSLDNDPTTGFGPDHQGYITHHNAAGGNGRDYAGGVALTDDGKIVVVGASERGLVQNSEADMTVWQLTAEGILDTSFGAGKGYITHSIIGGREEGSDVVITVDGKIIVVGEISPVTSSSDMTVWQLNPDGSLDNDPTTGFGPNHQGYITFDAGIDDIGNSIVLTADGKIIVTGDTGNLLASGIVDYYMTVWKLTAAGNLDSSFGPNGQGYMTHHNAAGGNADDEGNDVALTATGKIVVVGNSTSVGTDGYVDMVVWQLNQDGSLDNDPTTGFGPNHQGFITHDSAAGGNGNDAGYSVVLTNEPNQKIVVAGVSQYGSGAADNYLDMADMAVWRLTSDGNLDASFGPDGQGYMTYHNPVEGNSAAGGVALTPTDETVVAGMLFNDNGTGISSFDLMVWVMH